MPMRLNLLDGAETTQMLQHGIFYGKIKFERKI